MLRIALRATVHRAALDPGDHCGPWGQEQGAGQGLPPREARVQPLLGFGKQLLVEALRLDEELPAQLLARNGPGLGRLRERLAAVGHVFYVAGTVRVLASARAGQDDRSSCGTGADWVG
jgi:hypothetical protein